MRIRSTVALLAALALLAPPSAPAADGKTIVIPPGMDRAYDEFHYAPAVRVGDTVIVSGIPAGPGATYEERVRRLFERLKATLAAAGASLDDVVEITTYHREPRDSAAFRAEFEQFAAIHHATFRDGYPAWTAVGTTALLADGAPVELRALAIVGAGKRVTVQRSAPTP